MFLISYFTGSFFLKISIAARWSCPFIKFLDGLAPILLSVIFGPIVLLYQILLPRLLLLPITIPTVLSGFHRLGSASSRKFSLLHLLVFGFL